MAELFGRALFIVASVGVAVVVHLAFSSLRDKEVRFIAQLTVFLTIVGSLGLLMRVGHQLKWRSRPPRKKITSKRRREPILGRGG